MQRLVRGMKPALLTRALHSYPMLESQTASQRKTPVRLKASQKQAVIASLANGLSQRDAAKQFGVHHNTINGWVRSMRQSVTEAQNPLPQNWRNRLTDLLPAKATDAIERSVDDLNDVHKAAGTGLALLKGIGILAGDQGDTNISIVVQTINAMSPDLRERYIGLESFADVTNVTPVAREETDRAT